MMINACSWPSEKLRPVEVTQENKPPILVIEPAHMKAYRIKSMETKTISCWGTAFVMNGKIYTAAHCIFGPTFIEIKKGEWKKMKLLKLYKKKDVAVFENIGLPSTPRAKSRLDTCSALISNKGKPTVYVKGALLTRRWGRMDLCFSSMRVENGASGSPVYQDGGIAGMVVMIPKFDGVSFGCLVRSLEFLPLE